MAIKPPPTILIVDDKPTNLSVLVEYLSEQYRVLTAESGERALEILSFTHADMLLMDVMMPGMNGFQTCREIKRHPEWQHVPIIFLTALNETDDKVKGFECGAVDYITKPLNQYEVLARVKTHLTVHQLQCELEDKIVELDKSLEERDLLIQDLDAYASTVAHDLKNPVSVICGIADSLSIMLPKLDQKAVLERLGRISKSSWKLKEIIDDLLVFARVMREQIKRVDVDISAVVEQAVARMDNLVQSSGARVEIGELPRASGHAQWVEEVFYNYLTNAVKYGGRPPVIGVVGEVEQERERVVYRVLDNGEGLSSEARQQVFSPEYVPTRSAEDSHGIGLSIVKRIVQKLGGEVWVESREEGGSAFCLSLKLPETQKEGE